MSLLSDILFLIAYHLVRYRRRVTRDNLTHAFPDTSPADRRCIERAYYRHISDLLVEAVHNLYASPKAIKDRYRFGLGYRIAGSVNILASVDIISGLTLGYTFELPANRLLLESFGSHELFIAYGFDILKPRRTNRYKSVRYL